MSKNIEQAKQSIHKPSEEIDGVNIKGAEFNQTIDLKALLDSFGASGFQATHLAKAIEILKKVKQERAKTPGFKLFLGFTSNQVTSGNRELIRYLVEHKFVDALVTTAGGVEEDFIKCLKPFILGDFRAPGAALRDAGINRTGNIFVPNDRYIAFEEWLRPILDELTEKNTKQLIVSPSALIKILGERINSKDSIYYWAAKNNIPVFCPALTDGSFGDITFFHQINELNKGKQFIVLDSIADNATLNKLALDAEKTAVFVIGAGLVKHQILNANMMREGAEYSVYLNTSAEFDGSDSGAEPEEAKSWGKLSADANTVKVVCDATIALPLIIAGVYK